MIKLKKKHCSMGIINNRIEKHGDQDVTAFDIPVTILLDPDELNDLLGDPYKHRALFNTKGKVAEPMFPEFESFSLKHDLEDATVSLFIGSGDFEIEFEDVRLKGLVLTPVVGGETELYCKLQVCPQSKHITKLIDAQNTALRISVADAKVAEKAKRRQRELPLEPGEEGDSKGRGSGPFPFATH